MEFCASVRILLTLASIVSLHDIVRFNWASKMDRSIEEQEFDKSIFENKLDDDTKDSDGKNPKKVKFIFNLIY